MKNVVLLLLTLLISTCTQNQSNDCDFLKNSYIRNKINNYILKNNKSKLGIYYILFKKLNDSSEIEMSSMVFRSQVEDLEPCHITKLHGQYILIKCDKCNNHLEINGEINNYLLDVNEETEVVQPNGDTIIHHTDLLYNPEIMKIKFKN